MSSLKTCSTLQDPVTAIVANNTGPQWDSTTKTSLKVADIYHVASTAKIKLGDEVDCINQDLRRMVGHANLLDSLMVKLFDSEIEREDWLHENVHSASARVATRCMHWIDRILDDLDEGSVANDHQAGDDEGSESDESIELYDDNPLLFNSPLCRVKSRDALCIDDSEKVEGVEVLDAEKRIADNHDDLFVATVEHSLPKIVQEVETVMKGELLSSVVLIQTREVAENR